MSCRASGIPIRFVTIRPKPGLTISFARCVPHPAEEQVANLDGMRSNSAVEEAVGLTEPADDGSPAGSSIQPGFASGNMDAILVVTSTLLPSRAGPYRPESVLGQYAVGQYAFHSVQVGSSSVRSMTSGMRARCSRNCTLRP